MILRCQVGKGLRGSSPRLSCRRAQLPPAAPAGPRRPPGRPAPAPQATPDPCARVRMDKLTKEQLSAAFLGSVVGLRVAVLRNHKVALSKRAAPCSAARPVATAAAIAARTQGTAPARAATVMAPPNEAAAYEKTIRRRRKCKQLAAVTVVNEHLGQVQVDLPGGASVEATFVAFNHGTGHAVAVYHSDGADGAIAMPVGLLANHHKTWAEHLKRRSQKVKRHAATVAGSKGKPIFTAADFVGNGEHVTILPWATTSRGPSRPHKGYSCDKVRFFLDQPGYYSCNAAAISYSNLLLGHCLTISLAGNTGHACHAVHSRQVQRHGGLHGLLRHV